MSTLDKSPPACPLKHFHEGDKNRRPKIGRLFHLIQEACSCIGILERSHIPIPVRIIIAINPIARNKRSESRIVDHNIGNVMLTG